MQSETKAIAGNESNLQVRWLRRRRMGVIVLAAVVGIWLWQREPRYEGQPLGHWLGAYQSFKNGLGWDTREEESAAVLKRTQGKVVPHLIRLLQKEDSVFDEPWPPSPANDVLTAPLRDMAREWGLLPNRELRHRAGEALGFIGQQAKPALPELQRLMLQTDDYASPAAAGALARIGDEGMSFLVKTLREGTKLQRCQACYGLQKAKALSIEAVTALQERLATDTVSVRLHAAQALRQFQLAPEMIVRALLPFAEQGKKGDWIFNWVRMELRASFMKMGEPDLMKLFQEQSAANRKLIVSLLAKDNPAQAEALQRSVESF
jgi:HEAT repeat protein